MKKISNKKFIIIYILLCYIFISFFVVDDLYMNVFRRINPDNLLSLRYKDIEDNYNIEYIKFKSGKNNLQGYYFQTENPKALIILSHGIGGGAEIYLSTILYFVDNGFNVFAYDNTGCYNSEGDNSIGITQSVVDLNNALIFIENEDKFNNLPILLYGHSWGGYAVTSIFSFEHNITASVSVSGFNRPLNISYEWGETLLGPVFIFEKPFLFLYQKIKLKDTLDINAVNGINNTNKPIMIIHGINDDVILIKGEAIINFKNEITNPNVVYKICSEELLDGHNTLFTDKDSTIYKVEISKQLENTKNKSEVINNIDRYLYDKVDKDFMNDVIKFYENSLKEAQYEN